MNALTRPDAARFRAVDADDAGERYHYAPDGVVERCREAGILTHRQCDAAHRLSECYARGGGIVPFRRHGSGIGEEDEKAVRDWRDEYNRLLSAAPRATRWALQTLCQDQWCQNIQAWRLGLDAVADRLKLAR